MDKTWKFWVPLIIAILSGYDAIVRNLNNLINGFNNFWISLAPIIQLALVILALYLIFKKTTK